MKQSNKEEILVIREVDKTFWRYLNGNIILEGNLLSNAIVS